MSFKIAYCIPALYSASGMERVLALKANYFASHFGYEIYVIITDGGDKSPYFALLPQITLMSLNVNFDQLYGKPFWIRFFLYIYKQRLFKKRLSRYLKTIKPDITISTLRREINFINSIKDGSSKIGEIHFSKANYRDLNQERIPNYLKQLLGKLWMGQLISKINQLDRFIVLSYEDKENWTDVTPSRIEVINNPISFYPDNMSGCDEKRVIAVGRYTYQKGFDFLVDAWSIVHNIHPDWQLHIYGEGDRAPYQKQIDLLDLKDCCFLHPVCAKIEEKYLESSIFAFSSRYEGFGMVLVEAMACGVPPVSFACPCGPKDIIQDGVDGLLVENGNTEKLAEKICFLIENEDIRKEMGRNARKNVVRFNIDDIALQWDSLFRELVKTKNTED